jgi:hypothetical protein
MDEQAQKPEVDRAPRPLVVGLAAAWLASLLAMALWQGYGRWLLSEVGGHAG